MGRKASLFVNIWTSVCLYSTLLVIFNGKFAAAAPSVVVNFNDTRCAADGGRVCATDSLLFTCTGNEIGFLRMTLFSGERLALFSDGDITGIGDLRDGFSVEPAIVTMNDGGASFNYTLSVSIENASLLNGSMIDCDDNSPDNQDMAGCPVVDSPPSAPSGLDQNCDNNALTSSTANMAFANASFTWQAPNQTGGIGIDIAHYTVNTIVGHPVNTSTLSHTLTDLVVGRDHTVSVTVTATNECGLESNPSEDLVIGVLAGDPQPPTIKKTEIDCDVKVDGNMAPVTVMWENEPAPNSTCPEGLVYLPITGVNVNYTDPDDMMTTACANLNESSTSCLFSVSLTEDDSLNQKEFSVSVEVTDGKRVNVSSPSQFKSFRVVQTVFLDTPDQPPRVVIELNRNCRDDVYNIVVNFGTQQSAEDGCVIVPAARREEKWNPVLDQEPHPFMLDTNAVTLQEGAVYCYTATLNGTDLDVVPSVVPSGSSGSMFPNYAIIIIVIVVVVLVLQILLDFAICYLIWKEKNKRKALGEDGFSTCAIIIIVMSMLLSLLAIILLCVLIWKLTSHRRKDDLEMKTLRSSPGPSPVVKEPAGDTLHSAPPGDQGPMYQDPNTITHTAHPETGELYADIHLDKSKSKKKGKKTEEEATGAMYQDPSSIQHQQAESGDVYAMPQAKKSKKGKKREESVSEEEKAAMYSMPDRKGQKAKSEGLVYADLAISSSSQQPPPPQGSQYADIRHHD